MRYFLLICCSVVLSGCASSPVASGEAAPADTIYDNAMTQPRPNTGTVIVVRDSGFMGAACDNLVFIDGHKVADLGTGEKVAVYLAAGHHVLGTTSGSLCGGGSAGAETDLKAGDTRIYRIAHGQDGTLSMQPSAF